MVSLIVAFLFGLSIGALFGWYWHGKTIHIALQISNNFARVFGAPPIAEVVDAADAPLQKLPGPNKPEGPHLYTKEKDDDYRIAFEGDR